MESDAKKFGMEFFRQYAKGEPEEADHRLKDWLNSRQRSPRTEAVCRKVMEICSGLGEASVRHYLVGGTRLRFLSIENLDLLDRIAKALGKEPTQRVKLPPEAAPRPRRSNRVALLTQLQVPSQSYHMELIRGIVRSAEMHHLDIAVHEASPIDLGAAIDRVRTSFRPDAFVILRLTPSPQDLKAIESGSPPVVLVHADRYAYPRPVLANIVSKQEQLGADLEAWLDRHGSPARENRRRKKGRAGKAVLVRMPRETNACDFQRIAADIEPSIRNDRISRLEETLRKRFHLSSEEVPDYRFRHSLRVFNNHPDANLYVSLSDEIAVGLKHLLIATGRPWEQRIIGFDDSPMAKEEGLASFSHNLDQVGSLVVDCMIRRLRSESDQWLKFEELKTDVHLESRYFNNPEIHP